MSVALAARAGMIQSVAFELNIYCIMITGGIIFGMYIDMADIYCGNWFVATCGRIYGYCRSLPNLEFGKTYFNLEYAAGG